MGWVVQRHFKWHPGKQMNGLASSKQAWTKMDRLEGANLTPSHLRFSWRCISSVLSNQKCSELHRKGILKGDPNHFPGMLLELSKTLPEQPACPDTCAAPACWQKPCLCYCLLHAEFWFVFRDRSMISWNIFLVTINSVVWVRCLSFLALNTNYTP